MNGSSYSVILKLSYDGHLEYLTNRFYLAVRLYSNRLQMTARYNLFVLYSFGDIRFVFSLECTLNKPINIMSTVYGCSLGHSVFMHPNNVKTKRLKINYVQLNSANVSKNRYLETNLYSVPDMRKNNLNYLYCKSLHGEQ